MLQGRRPTIFAFVIGTGALIFATPLQRLSVSKRPRNKKAVCPHRHFSACLNPVDRKLQDEKDANKGLHTHGEVYLVGTGPGDPRMLTLGAVELLETADVVLYDRLVSVDILSFINPAAEKICVGKGRGIGTGSQLSIQQELSRHAALGKRVVRLKGGDPAIFGRLGDELHYLRETDELDAAIVPGVTAASGVAASLGFPLTHGGVAEELRLLTGHGGKDKRFEIAKVTEGSTLVIYMGLRELGPVLETLQISGARSDLPAVAVQNATKEEQRVVWGQVGSLVKRVEEAKLGSPTLVVIGEVVRMAKDWKD